MLIVSLQRKTGLLAVNGGASQRGFLPRCINSQLEQTQVTLLCESVMSAHVLDFILSLMKPKPEVSRYNLVYSSVPSSLGLELTDVLLEGKQTLHCIRYDFRLFSALLSMCF